MLAVVFQFLEADTPDKRRACIAAHPELLGPAAGAALADLSDKAGRAGRADLAAKLDECRVALAQVRAAGMANGPGSAAPSRSGGDRAPGIPAEAGLLLAEFRQLGPTADPQRRVGVLRRLVQLIDPRVHGKLAAVLQGALGAGLAELGDRTGAGDYDEAIASFQAAQELLSKESDPRQRLMNAHQLGGIFARRRTGDPSASLEAAIKHLGEAVSTGDGQLPPPLGARAHAQLAEVYLRRLAGQRADNVECAIGHLNAAAGVLTRKKFPAEWADVCCSLGIAFRERVRCSREENLDRAMRYFQQVRDPQVRKRWPEAYARACNGLGTVYVGRIGDTREDDVERAIGCYREACDILAARGLTVELATARHNLGNAYLHRIAKKPADNIELAIGCLEDALTARTREALPLDWAATRQALGNAYLLRGREERAQNIEIAIAALGDAERTYARCTAVRQQAMAQHDLAHAYVSRILGVRADNVRQAISCLQAALKVFTAESMVVEQAAVLTALGNAVSERAAQDRTEPLGSAMGYHTQALQALGGRAASPALWAVVQNNLGTAYVESRAGERHDDLGSAIACFTEALAAGSATRSPLEQAMTRHNLGVAYAERAGDAHPGDLPEAIRQFTAAVEVYAAVGVSRHKRASAQALGDAHARLGHWPEACRAYAIALDAADDMYVSSVRLDAREAELAETRGLHPRAAFAAAATGQLEQAVAILERGRARGLGDARARDAAELQDIRRLDPQLAGAFLAAARELRELEGMDWRSAAGTDGQMTGRPGTGPGRDDDLRQQLETARARLRETVAQIRRLKDHGRFLVQPGFGDVAAVVAKAGPVAYLAVTDAGSLTLLVAEPDGAPTGGRQGRRWVEPVAQPAEPLTSETLGSLLVGRGEGGVVTGGYLPAQMAMDDSPLAFTDALEALLAVLGERLIAPLAEKLSADRAGSVTVVACGLLGLLPLHAATYRREGKERCLLDDCAVSYAPSARVLAAAHSALSARPAHAPVLAGVGDPAGGQPLPFARAELEEISAHFHTPRPFYGSHATKPALLGAAEGATYIHFSCHGLFDPVAPRDSALVLAGDGEPDLLTLREVIASRPFADARLVVASACETAFTDFTHLPDETIGLPAGFLQAGTPGVVGTLWEVTDVSTALLMTRFYEYLLGPDGRPRARPEPPGQALRRAQLWLARVSAAELQEYLSRHPALRAAGAYVPRGERPFAHPFYWAPFVLVGT